MVMERALACAKRIEEGWCLAELLRENGELLLVRAAPTDVANAENVSGSRSSGGDVRTLSRGSCGARRALQRRIVDRRSLWVSSGS